MKAVPNGKEKDVPGFSKSSITVYRLHGMKIPDDLNSLSIHFSLPSSPARMCFTDAYVM
jgi:hypothetical protein